MRYWFGVDEGCTHDIVLFAWPACTTLCLRVHAIHVRLHLDTCCLQAALSRHALLSWSPAFRVMAALPLSGLVGFGSWLLEYHRVIIHH